MLDYLLLVGAVFVINLLPAFGPPTWAVLVVFRLNWALEVVPLVTLGAVAAACGRLALATGARRLRSHFSQERLDSLAAAEGALTGSRGKGAIGLGLFAVSPVPSAQLFVGAGLLTVPLLPLTGAFFAGRIVSYSLYVGAASLAADSFGDVVVDSLTSPVGIALQMAMLAALVALLRVDWVRVLGRRSRNPVGRGTAA